MGYNLVHMIQIETDRANHATFRVGSAIMDKMKSIQINFAFLVLIAIIFLIVSSPVLADIKEAKSAYEKKYFTTAFRKFMPLAEKGNPEAQYFVGRMYVYGQRVPKDYSLALKWLRMSASQGFVDAEHALGFLYIKGNGVKKSYDLAKKWFHKAALNGHAKSIFYIGLMYENGFGYSKDLEKAANWYQKSSKLGCGRAYRRLGLFYFEGDSVDEDKLKAAQLFQKSAILGSTRSQYNLGLMYAKGWGFDKDFAKSFFWTTLAVMRSKKEMIEKPEFVKLYKQASENRNTLLGFLTQSQVAFAIQKAKSWKPTGPIPPVC